MVNETNDATDSPWLFDIANDLTDEQKRDLSHKIELLMGKYANLGGRESEYFSGCVDGMNHAHKLINEEVDDYLAK